MMVYIWYDTHMKEDSIHLLQTVAGWAAIVAAVGTVFLPSRTIQFGAAATWLLLGCWMFFGAWHGYLIKEYGVINMADDYVGRHAEIAAMIMMVFAVVIFVLPAVGWLVLQLMRFAR